MNWSDKALAAVHRVAKTHPTFFSDDIWNILGRDPNVELRNLGAVMKRARANGWCKVTGDYRRVAGNHRHLRPIWKSRICGVNR